VSSLLHNPPPRGRSSEGGRSLILLLHRLFFERLSASLMDIFSDLLSCLTLSSFSLIRFGSRIGASFSFPAALSDSPPPSVTPKQTAAVSASPSPAFIPRNSAPGCSSCKFFVCQVLAPSPFWPFWLGESFPARLSCEAASKANHTPPFLTRLWTVLSPSSGFFLERYPVPPLCEVLRRVRPCHHLSVP